MGGQIQSGIQINRLIHSSASLVCQTSVRSSIAVEMAIGSRSRTTPGLLAPAT